VFDEFHKRGQAILSELHELAGRVRTLPASRPVIVLGDFNVAAGQPAMNQFLAQSGLTDAAADAGKDTLATWDPARNHNVVFSRKERYVDGDRLAPLDLLSSAYDGEARRIDYVLLNGAFDRNDVRAVKTVLDSADNGLFASDHYGVIAELSTTALRTKQPPEEETVPPLEESTTEPLPIVSYDTDVGFGYGAKVFCLNALHQHESFDVVLFNSTKGERWYRFVFSIPDFELRQGKIYPMALDLTVDYDKYLKNSFFGVGNGSRFRDREYYTREPLEVTLAASRGISQHTVVQAGVKFKYARNFSFSDTSYLATLAPSLNAGVVRYHALFAGYRYDTRNSYINPSRGLVLQAEGEYAPRSPWTNVGLGRVGAWVQYYATLFYPKSVLALRIGAQNIIGENLPVQVLLPIGGNQTLRGSPQDRFLDKTSAIVNAELRFPIWWRFGGVLGEDAGRVWSEPAAFSFGRWATNPVVGLRFFMETFVVRLDFGFGSETTGFYLNFGHLF
ncbi:MAG TPA: BamA/TamA family outer membrane protein, partial [Bacteroidota bacterium]|nr:BamA/TamA family outer membrane protein [Bacteroidota bacterium]